MSQTLAEKGWQKLKEMSNTTVSYGSANWTYDEIDDNSTNANPILGTFKSSGTWQFIPPTHSKEIQDRIWDEMFALSQGDLSLSLDDLTKLIEAIDKYGPELGKLHFILHR